MKKKIIFGSVIICFAVLIFAFVLSNRTSIKLKNQLDLGQKYMDELNYEQAIASYENAIAIDSQSVDAYLRMAEAYMGEGKVDIAYEILQEGHRLTQDERILIRLNDVDKELEKNEKKVTGLSKETEEIVQIGQEVENKSILIKEFVETPTIIGKPWKDVTIEEFYEHYGLSQRKSLIKLNDNWMVYYNHETQARMAFFQEGIDVNYSIDKLQKNNQFSFPKYFVSSDIDFSIMEGYSEYVTKNDIDSLEDFLIIWEVDKASEEFMRILREMRVGENKKDFYTMDFQSDYGEVGLTLQYAGSEIRMGIYFRNESTWADHIGITEDENSIDIIYFFR